MVTSHEAPELYFLDPGSNSPLHFTAIDAGEGNSRWADGVWQTDNGQAWPQIDGIPFLRSGREALASEAAALLCSGQRVEALGLLLTDVDDFAAAAPDFDTALRVVHAVEHAQISALQAMYDLAYGPVADYFAIRPSTPTFISGLQLLAAHVDSSRPVMELACGMGHFLSHLSRHGVRCGGCDVTFSKLWLGRRFLLPDRVSLVCADITGGTAFVMRAQQPLCVFCHDAFYFLPHKRTAARRMQALAGSDGQVLLGHVHLAGYDHAGIGGDLYSAPDYSALFETVTHVYDDAELIHAWSSRSTPSAVSAESLAGREAMAMAAGTSASGDPQEPVTLDLRLDPPDELLYANPLLRPDASGALLPGWPSDAFSKEYSEAAYLGGTGTPEPGALPRMANEISVDQQIQRLGLPAAFVRVATIPLRWAVIGCGWVARDHVLPAFAHAPNARLVALCDSDPAKLTNCMAANENGPARYTDHRAMLQEEKPDVVYIATPNHCHAALCIDAANAGCDVLCEKPMAASLGDARAMVASSQATGITYATAFDQRFHEAHHVLRSAVRQGRLGTITQARIHYACQVDTNWRATADDPDNWRLDRERAGGGAVIDLAPHALDLLAFVLDDEPCVLDMRLQSRMTGSVPAEVARDRLTGDSSLEGTPGAWDVDAGGVLSVGFSRGTLASIHVSYQTPEFLPRRDIELIGTLGGARGLNTMGQTPGGQIEWRDRDNTRTEMFSTHSALSPFARQIEAFSAFRKSRQVWPFSPQRDLAHFELLLGAMNRAEATFLSAREPV